LWRGSGCHCVSQERVTGARSPVDIDALLVLRIVSGESVVYLETFTSCVSEGSHCGVAEVPRLLLLELTEGWWW
jgi:hypothetical protein